MRTWIAGSLLTLALAVAAPPAGAESRDAESRDPLDFGVEFGIDADSFRLGGRLPGPAGVYRFRVGGRPRPHGFTLEGWLDDGGLTRGFTFDARLTPWRRARPDTL
jgi:hypothetical protein